MVKVGDTVKLVEKYRGWCCARNFGRNGIVTSISGNYARVTFEGDDLPYKEDSGDIEALKVVSSTPPQKIAQNGYEYSLVGPVKPEWLVDGAWVVRKDNGETNQINQQSENMFSATSSHSRVTGLTSKRVSEEFRPYTVSDWKWGDWAMYDGKRVFVMTGADKDGYIGASYPGIDPLGCDEVSKNYDYFAVSKLTPTF